MATAYFLKASTCVSIVGRHGQGYWEHQLRALHKTPVPQETGGRGHHSKKEEGLQRKPFPHHHHLCLKRAPLL